MTTSLPQDTVKTNVFTKFPPIIPMVVIGTVLIAAAQFGSTEKLAAAFAWLIFVAVTLADSGEAFNMITGRLTGGSGTSATLPPGKAADDLTNSSVA